MLKRRLIFDPLPETEPLLAKMQRALPKTKVLLPPCYYRRPLLNPEALLQPVANCLTWIDTSIRAKILK